MQILGIFGVFMGQNRRFFDFFGFEIGLFEPQNVLLGIKKITCFSLVFGEIINNDYLYALKSVCEHKQLTLILTKF